METKNIQRLETTLESFKVEVSNPYHYLYLQEFMELCLVELKRINRLLEKKGDK